MTALRREAAQWKIPEAKTGTRRILIALLLLSWEKYRTKFESRNPTHVRPNTQTELIQNQDNVRNNIRSLDGWSYIYF